MSKRPNPADDSRPNRRKTRRDIAALEREVKKIKKVVGIMAVWIAQTDNGCLSAENAAQLIAKLK